MPLPLPCGWPERSTFLECAPSETIVTRRRRTGAGRRGAQRRGEVAGAGDLARTLVDWCQLWEVCGRTACRRARACRVTTVPCFGEHIATVFALVEEEPAFRRLLETAEEANGWVDG